VDWSTHFEWLATGDNKAIRDCEMAPGTGKARRSWEGEMAREVLGSGVRRPPWPGKAGDPGRGEAIRGGVRAGRPRFGVSRPA